MVQGISNDIMMTMGGGSVGGMVGGVNHMPQTGDNISGMAGREPANVANARERAENASQPTGGIVKA